MKIRKYFPIIWNGFDKNGLAAFEGRRVLSLEWPKIQTIGGLWGLRLCWENKEVWRFKNIPVMIEVKEGFEFEIGTLLIEKSSVELDSSGSEEVNYVIEHFVLKKLKIASGCESGVITDCAIMLIGKTGKELMISTAVPPTTVTFGVSGGPYPNPEFPLSSLKWRDIGEEFNS